jgi:hypothetical protein
MSSGRHAKPRPPRSDAPLALLVVLLALGIGAAALVADGLDVLKLAVAGLAVLCVLVVILTRTSGRRATAALQNALDDTQRQNRSLRIEIERLQSVNNELVIEVARLREQMAGYLTPVPAAPEPIYPSLHLPLVRAAFADELPSVTSLPAPVEQKDDADVDVEGESGHDPRPPRQLLDLTASEIARLRTAN